MEWWARCGTVFVQWRETDSIFLWVVGNEKYEINTPLINRQIIIKLTSLKNLMVESLNEELVNKFETELQLEEEQSIT